MSAVVSLAASGVLVALGVWLLGGFVLRTGGAFLAVGGLFATATTGSLTMAAATITGTVAWLAGHWLFALRPHYFRSPLARSAFFSLGSPPRSIRRGGGVYRISRRGAADEPT